MLKKLLGQPKSMDSILKTFAQAHADLEEHADFQTQQIQAKSNEIADLRYAIDEHRKSQSHAILVQEALRPFLPLP